MIALISYNTFDITGSIEYFTEDNFDTACKKMKIEFEKTLIQEKHYSIISRLRCFCDMKNGVARLTWIDDSYAEWRVLKIKDSDLIGCLFSDNFLKSVSLKDIEFFLELKSSETGTIYHEIASGFIDNDQKIKFLYKNQKDKLISWRIL